MDLFELSATLGLDTSAFSAGLQGALGLAKKFAGAVVDFGKDVIETGMGFDKQMSAVQAVLGSAEGTVENMNRLRAFALEQARDSIFTAEQTAEAYYYMGMAGWKAQQMTAGLPGIMALAAASGEDLGMVSDIVTDSLTAFGLTADDTSWYVDILAQAATNSNTDVKRMGETFKYVAPIAGSLGVEVEDAALAIGLMASQSIKGSMAGTALRNILTRLSTNAGETKKDMGALTILTEKLGVQFWDSSGKMRDFSDIIREARVSWQELTQEEAIYYAKQIGSQRGMSAWLALMNAAEEDVDKLAYAFANAEGAAQGMADVKLDNLWGDLQLFNSSLDVLKNALYEDAKSPLRDVVQYATDALDRIKDAVDEGGILGGLQQLGTELRQFGKEYKDEIAALGEAIVPILTEFINTVTPAFIDMAVTLGRSFAAGILEGAKESIEGNWLTSLLGINFGTIGTPQQQDNVREQIKSDVEQYKQGLGEAIEDGEPIIAAPKIALSLENVEMRTDTVQDAIDKAMANGENTITLAGLTFDVTESAEYIASTLTNYLQGAGEEGGIVLAQSVYNAGSDASLALSEDIATDLSNAGETGGEKLGDHIKSAISIIGPTIGNMIATDIGDSGITAGSWLAANIQNALNKARFAVNVVQNVSSIVSRFGIKKNASAMATGRIFKSPTIFGYDDGKLQVAGDAGPEAVVGTNSLIRMIQSAVANASTETRTVVPRNGGSQNLTVIFECDRMQLGRVVYKLNNEETQRVGVKLSGGYT